MSERDEDGNCNEEREHDKAKFVEPEYECSHCKRPMYNNQPSLCSHCIKNNSDRYLHHPEYLHNELLKLTNKNLSLHRHHVHKRRHHSPRYLNVLNRKHLQRQHLTDKEIRAWLQNLRSDDSDCVCGGNVRYIYVMDRRNDPERHVQYSSDPPSTSGYNRDAAVSTELFTREAGGTPELFNRDLPSTSQCNPDLPSTSGYNRDAAGPSGLFTRDAAVSTELCTRDAAGPSGLFTRDAAVSTQLFTREAGGTPELLNRDIPSTSGYNGGQNMCIVAPFTSGFSVEAGGTPELLNRDLPSTSQCNPDLPSTSGYNRGTAGEPGTANGRCQVERANVEPFRKSARIAEERKKLPKTKKEGAGKGRKRNKKDDIKRTHKKRNEK